MPRKKIFSTRSNCCSTCSRTTSRCPREYGLRGDDFFFLALSITRSHLVEMFGNYLHVFRPKIRIPEKPLLVRFVDPPSHLQNNWFKENVLVAFLSLSLSHTFDHSTHISLLFFQLLGTFVYVSLYIKTVLRPLLAQPLCFSIL